MSSCRSPHEVRACLPTEARTKYGRSFTRDDALTPFGLPHCGARQPSPGSDLHRRAGGTQSLSIPVLTWLRIAESPSSVPSVYRQVHPASRPSNIRLSTVARPTWKVSVNAQDHCFDLGFCARKDRVAFFAEAFCLGVNRVNLIGDLVLDLDRRNWYQ